jgi:hypothetical protein
MKALDLAGSERLSKTKVSFGSILLSHLVFCIVINPKVILKLNFFGEEKMEIL